MAHVIPHLWFQVQADEAMEFYVSVFKDPRVLARTELSDPEVSVVRFALAGLPVERARRVLQAMQKMTRSVITDLERRTGVETRVGEMTREGESSRMAARLPSGKIAVPSDVAPAYLYVLESDFTTGETIHIDGGQRLI